MQNTSMAPKLDDGIRREQLKLIYDYVKFHIALYIGTPAALAVIADAFGVKQSAIFGLGLLLAIGVYVRAGIYAAYFMSRHVNDQWRTDYLDKFEAEAFTEKRRWRHHSLYWIGLGLGAAGLSAALVAKYLPIVWQMLK